MSLTSNRPFQSMFPRLPLEVEYSWAGTFAETADGLPFIGAHPSRPGMLFALCFGGNGITYSAIASELIASTFSKRGHPLQELLGFSRVNATGSDDAPAIHP